MNFTSTRYPFIIGVILSILLHLVGLNFSAPDHSVKTKETQPVYVEVVPTEAVKTPPQRETILPEQPEEPPLTPQRQGAVDQRVEKELAPQGNDIEDSSPIAALQPPQPKNEEPQPPQNIVPDQIEAISANRPAHQPDQLPTLKDLFQSATNVAIDIGREEQTKQRPNIESGDEILLNMQQDKLFSFFNRFRKGIYSVWNYPKESIDQGQQGVVLIKILINRDGTVDDVEVLSGAQHERLNREAIAAIFKGQPYGALPEDFEEDQLTIHAFFEYILGQSRPRIYRR